MPEKANSDRLVLPRATIPAAVRFETIGASACFRRGVGEQRRPGGGAGPRHVHEILPSHGHAIERTCRAPFAIAPPARSRLAPGALVRHQDEGGIFPLLRYAIQKEFGGLDGIQRPGGEKAADRRGGMMFQPFEHERLPSFLDRRRPLFGRRRRRKPLTQYSQEARLSRRMSRRDEPLHGRFDNGRSMSRHGFSAPHGSGIPRSAGIRRLGRTRAWRRSECDRGTYIPLAVITAWVALKPAADGG